MQTPISTSNTPSMIPPPVGCPPRLTMYDLPSKFPGERGLPDEYHDLQPEFLSATLQLTNFGAQQRFTSTDMCLYYDEAHPLWHKRPDWFLALGVPRLYGETDLRLSYTAWAEGVSPSVIIELISPGTEKQDLGPFYRSAGRIDPTVLDEPEVDAELGNGQISGQPLIELIQSRDKAKPKPPEKWEVYEQILKVPYYITYSRYSNRLRCFRLQEDRYEEETLDLTNPRFWLEELQIGLSIWQGEYQGITRPWLRWFDADGDWVLTPEERERQRADLAQQQANAAERRTQRLLERLKQEGIEIDPETL